MTLLLVQVSEFASWIQCVHVDFTSPIVFHVVARVRRRRRRRIYQGGTHSLFKAIQSFQLKLSWFLSCGLTVCVVVLSTERSWVRFVIFLFFFIFLFLFIYLFIIFNLFIFNLFIYLFFFLHLALVPCFSLCRFSNTSDPPPTSRPLSRLRARCWLVLSRSVHQVTCPRVCFSLQALSVGGAWLLVF